MQKEKDDSPPNKILKWKAEYNCNRKFREEWKTKFKWVTKDSISEKPKCLACDKIINCSVTHLQRHEMTDSHKSNIKKSEKTPLIQNYCNKATDKQTHLVKSAELKLLMFLHEHNLPFLLMDHLPQLLRSVCPDSQVAKQIKCARTKSTTLTKECIAKYQLNLITENLNKNVFSLIIDETTDIGTDKSLAMVARFFDPSERAWKDHFLALIKVKSSTAEDLFNTVSNFFAEQQISLNNLIGFAADNASVMMGNLNGVQAKFKQILPNIFVLGCICHSFHLCSSAAAKKLPSYLEDVVRGVYNYFAHSSKRAEKLKEFQAFIELKPHKLLRPNQTRWLSLQVVYFCCIFFLYCDVYNYNFQAAVDRLLENWDALILFFTSECYEESLHSNQIILTFLQNPITKLYFLFLSYVLDIVNKMNLEFQSERPKLHLLLSRITDLYRTLLRSFIRKTHLDGTSLQDINVTNPEHYTEVENIYFGAKVDVAIAKQTIDSKELNNFRLKCLDFYVELANQIKSRFRFDNPVLTFVSYFEPKIALSGDIRSIAVQSVQHFPHLVNDIEALNSEWRLLADMTELKQYLKCSAEEFWLKIFDIKNPLEQFIFPNLIKLVQGIFSLPHSSACAERIFSQLTLMKTKVRNRMEVDTCDSILHAKQLLNKNNCYTWQPSHVLLESAKRVQ